MQLFFPAFDDILKEFEEAMATFRKILANNVLGIF